MTRARRAAGAFLLFLAAGGSFAAPAAFALDPRCALTQYQRQTWGPEQGLPCNNVLAVTQTEDGYLWLGTEEGLVRFDGVRARVFDHQTDPALVGNSVYTLTEDSRQPGELLLGSAGGICRYAAGKVALFKPNAELAGFPGVILFRDPADGALWVRSLRGVFQVAADGTLNHPDAVFPGWPTGKVRTVCRDHAGRLWVGAAEGLYRQEGKPGSLPGFALVPGWAGKAVDYLSPTRSGGGLWVGSREGGTGRMDEDGVFHPRPQLAGCLVTTMLEGRAGVLWVGTNGSGLFRLPAGDGPPPAETAVTATVEAAAAAFTTDQGLLHNLVNGLCEDREGNLWIATQMGLQVLRDVRFVNFGRPEGLAGDDVRSVFEDSRGSIWIGHENGLGRLDSAGERVTNFPPPPSPRRPGNSRVICVGEGADGDRVWAGTNAGMVAWRDGVLSLLPLGEDLDRSAVRAFCRDAAGDCWIGTNSGLYRVRNRRLQNQFTVADGLANDSVRALHADRRGNLWIATGGGLSRRGPDGEFTNFLNFGPGRGDGTVLSFFSDPGRPEELFVGTEFGLHRLRVGEDGAVQIRGYGIRQGLFDDIVWAVLGDGRGNLWLTSNKGVSRVAQADLDRFDRGEIPRVPHAVYNVADGMRSRECNGGHQPAACRDRDGRLWFATVKGAAVVDPGSLAPDPRPPPVHLEEVTADGRTWFAETADGSAPELPPGTQKLGFRYTALSFLAPETNRFRYWLEGFDAGWTDGKTERTARYTNLPPGNYRFSVQAAKAEGGWNPQTASFAFRLRPFFYQTGWFRALVLVSAAGLLGALQQGLRRRLHARLSRAEAEVRERTRNEETLRRANEEAEQGRQIARQAQAEAESAREEAERANAAKSKFLSRMSHELRTPLNAILGFGQLLEMDDLTDQQEQSVEHILGGGRHLLGLVDEILDLARIESGGAAVRVEPVEFAPLLKEVTGLIAPLVRERGVHLHAGSGAAGATFLLADRQRLKQVLLNLLVNAVKYNRGVGGEVFVGVNEVANPDGPETAGSYRARITVRDTGAGIDPAGLGKLFTPFERLGAAYGPVEGTGLGLAVSKQLVQAMHGTIGAESVVGVGSTFWVELPGVPPPSPAGSPEPRLPRSAPGPDDASAPGKPAPEPPSWAGPGDAEAPAGPQVPGVLYIEDNVSNRHLVEIILAQHRPDLRLRCAPDGISGLTAARMSPLPKLILLDLQLPDLDGDEVLDRLREDRATLHIPVVVLSADATSRSRKRLREAGAADYLTKPLELPRLLEVLAGYFPDEVND